MQNTIHSMTPPALAFLNPRPIHIAPRPTCIPLRQLDLTNVPDTNFLVLNSAPLLTLASFASLLIAVFSVLLDLRGRDLLLIYDVTLDLLPKIVVRRSACLICAFLCTFKSCLPVSNSVLSGSLLSSPLSD